MKKKAGFTLTILILVMLASFSGFAKDEPQTRTLSGQVTNHAGTPLSNAVVYMKNTKTLTVKTFVTDSEGSYRFPELSPNIDYEVYAEFNGTKSDVKTLSSFDSRTKPVINLKIDNK